MAELIEWGAAFDSEAGELLRTREGAHSLPRILHANGDATGAEISRSLAALRRVHKRIRFAEWTIVTGLVVADAARSPPTCSTANAARSAFWSGSARAPSSSPLAVGQVYSDTTNPAVATGDGIALAAAAGAALADMSSRSILIPPRSIDSAARRASCSLKPSRCRR